MNNRQSATRVALSTTLSILVAGIAWAQKIEIGYDKSADFSQYKTCAWLPRTTPANNPEAQQIA